MVLGIQIFGLLFGIFMIYYVFLHYKRKEFTTKEFTFWFVLWIAFILVTQFPKLLDPVLQSWGFARALDFLIVFGFIFLIGSIFYTYALVRKNQKRIEEIVRMIALQRKK